MDSKLKEIIFITNYLNNCELEENSNNLQKVELTRNLLNCRIRQVLQERIKNNNCMYKTKKSFFHFLTNIIF